MGKKIIWLVLIAVLAFCSTRIYGATVDISWDVSTGATGYKAVVSTDFGATWSAETDMGNVLSYSLTVPDNLLVLIKIAAYNAVGETWRDDAGVWFNSSWTPLPPPSGIGVQ